MFKRLRNMDLMMNLAVLALIAMGIFFIYSAAFSKISGASKLFYERQLIWAFVGCGLFLFFFYWDYRKLLKWAPLFYCLGLFFLFFVLLIGSKKLGAQRWLSIGGFAFQPSEFSKLSLILVLSAYLSHFSEHHMKFKYFLGALVLMALPMLFIMKQPDLGTALIYLPIFLTMLYVARVPLKYLIGLLVSGMAVSPFMWMFLKEYQKNRLLVFMNPDRDPLGAGYNLIQSKIAVGSGGWFGKGWLEGTQNQLNFLPERHTDFIFSVIGEEWGFLGGLLVLLLFFIVISGALNVSDKAQDQSGQIMASGIAAFFIAHVFINIGMTIGIMPITGLPLPFVSYGGTSLIVMMAALALLQNIYSRRFYF